MPTNFPTDLDTFVNPLSSDPPSNPDHAGQHTNINDAMLAVETKLGKDNSADTTSIDYRSRHLAMGNLLLVDAVNGNDSTGARGDLRLPFLTLNAAKTAASSGDLIWVLPGTYDERDLLKNGVNWHFEAGAVVDYTGADYGAIFDDTVTGANGAVTCRISGRGVFKQRTSNTDAPSLGTAVCNVLSCTNPSSDITAEGEELFLDAPGSFSGLSVGKCCIYHLDGALTYRFDKIIATGNKPATYAIWWRSGEHHGSGGVVQASWYWFYCDASTGTTNSCWLEFDSYQGLANNHNGGYGLGSIVASPTNTQAPNVRIWLRGKEIRGRILHTACRLYIDTEKMWSPDDGLPPIQTTSAGELWLNVQKLSLVGGFGQGAAIQPVAANGGSAHVRIMHVENTADMTFGPLIYLKGPVRCHVDDMVLVAGDIAGVQLNAGAVFSGRIDASAATGGNPLVVDENGAFVEDAVLLANGSQDCIITSGSAQTLTVQGSLAINTTINGNVTLASQVQLTALSGTLAIGHGGTGQTTAPNAINALVPSQSSNSGKFLTTNGSVVSWATASTSPAGSDTQIQFNSSGSFGASSNLIWNGTHIQIDSTQDASDAARLVVGGPSDTARILLSPAGNRRWWMQTSGGTFSIGEMITGISFIEITASGVFSLTGANQIMFPAGGNLNFIVDANALVFFARRGGGPFHSYCGYNGTFNINQGMTTGTDGTTVLTISSGGVTGVLLGASASFAKVGGAIFDHYADAASTHTDGTEDDLYSDTIPGSTLVNNGDKLFAEYSLTIAAHAASTDTIRAYFGGTKVLDSGANTFASGGNADVNITVIRESSSVARVKAEFIPSGITLQPVVTYTRVTGLTLTSNQILKITGIAASTGAASGDITAKLGAVSWLPAA